MKQSQLKPDMSNIVMNHIQEEVSNTSLKYRYIGFSDMDSLFQVSIIIHEQEKNLLSMLDDYARDNDLYDDRYPTDVVL